MAWSRVLKTINGHRYVYAQRTWREGPRVRAESRYLGRETRGFGVLFHGSRTGLRGRPFPSDNATYGPGFYLASRPDAELYARYDPGLVGGELPTAPQYRGSVHAFDTGALHLLILKDRGAYLRIAAALLGGDAEADPALRIALQQLWERQGYDGVVVLDAVKPATVVFPAALTKLGDAVLHSTVM